MLSDEDNGAAEMRNTTLKRMQYLILYMILAIWLVEAISRIVATTIVVLREKVHDILHLNVRKRKGELEWEHNYSHVWIDLLKVSPWLKGAHQLLEIKKDVALKR
jgi:hypothetical protein